jgi:hypothetical protein
VITDPVPRGAAKRAEYDRSDALVAMPLPPDPARIRAHGAAITAAIQAGDASLVRDTSVQLLAALSDFYKTPVPPLRVLGIRPHKVSAGVCTYQLFGDYTPSTQRIRVWMRTAIRGQVSSPRAHINTLLHEFCHHLDCTRLCCPESYHTRGFFWRIDHLYHLTIGTAPDRRRPLRWIRRGGVWMIDWAALRGPKAQG